MATRDLVACGECMAWRMGCQALQVSCGVHSSHLVARCEHCHKFLFALVSPLSLDWPLAGVCEGWIGGKADIGNVSASGMLLRLSEKIRCAGGVGVGEGVRAGCVLSVVCPAGRSPVTICVRTPSIVPQTMTRKIGWIGI